MRASFGAGVLAATLSLAPALAISAQDAARYVGVGVIVGQNHTNFTGSGSYRMANRTSFMAGATADEWDKAITRAQLEEWGKDMTTELRTLADVWMDRGKEAGREAGMALGEATGMAKGMAKTFLLLLNQRFGEVPPDVHSLVQDASLDSLEEWLRAIFDADSIDNVFNGNGRWRDTVLMERRSRVAGQG